MRHLFAFASLACIILAQACQPEQAVTQDAHPAERYSLDDRDWPGLAVFAGLAERQGFRLIQPEAIELRHELSVDQPLLLFPGAQVSDVAALLDWVNRGGRLFIADELGGLAPAMQVFDISLISAPPNHQALRALPVDSDTPSVILAEPSDEARGSWALSGVLTNNPAYLTGAQVSLFSFNDDQLLMGSGRYGEGLAYFLADPSVFTNQMLSMADNAGAAMALLDELCGAGRSSPCEPVIGAMGTRVWADGGASGGFVGAIVRLFAGSRADELEQNSAAPRGLIVLVAFMLLGFVFWLLKRPVNTEDALHLAVHPMDSGSAGRSSGDWSRWRQAERLCVELLIVRLEAKYGGRALKVSSAQRPLALLDRFAASPVTEAAGWSEKERRWLDSRWIRLCGEGSSAVGERDADLSFERTYNLVSRALNLIADDEAGLREEAANGDA